MMFCSLACACKIPGLKWNDVLNKMVQDRPLQIMPLLIGTCLDVSLQDLQIKPLNRHHKPEEEKVDYGELMIVERDFWWVSRKWNTTSRLMVHTNYIMCHTFKVWDPSKLLKMCQLLHINHYWEILNLQDLKKLWIFNWELREFNLNRGQYMTMRYNVSLSTINEKLVIIPMNGKRKRKFSIIFPHSICIVMS